MTWQAETYPGTIPATWLAERAAVEALKRDRPTVFALDEIEHIAPELGMEAHWDQDFLHLWKTLRAVQNENRHISFIVAGSFWFSHHRRLAVAPEGGRGAVFLNLFFLLSNYTFASPKKQTRKASILGVKRH